MFAELGTMLSIGSLAYLSASRERCDRDHVPVAIGEIEPRSIPDIIV